VQKSERRDERRVVRARYSIAWTGADGKSLATDVTAIDVSKTGMRIDCSDGMPQGATVFVQAKDSTFSGHATVRHCTAFGERYRIGLEFCEDIKQRGAAPDADEMDWYDVLQISPQADSETIHRVYRIMAARFHPDNPETGDIETFLLLTSAYEVLSDPDKRTAYDAMHASRISGPDPIFEMKDFVDGVKGELNRRLGVLSLLYNQRRMDPEHPGISLLDLERRMAFPREYLVFTVWYLRSKQFVTMADNSDLALTAEGADYVEENTSDSEILSKLISGGAWSAPRTRTTEERKQPARVAAKMLRIEAGHRLTV
jgi:curved DNA-binding protein CbpA